MREMRAADVKFRREKDEWYKFPLTFWEIVDKLDWRHNLRKDTKTLLKEFHTLCNNNDYIIEYFRDMRRDYVDVLRKTLYEYELKVSGHRASDYVDASDDRLDDILNHIVGLGKDVYFDVLNHIEKVRDYQKEAVESFTYVMTGRRPE